MSSTSMMKCTAAVSACVMLMLVGLLGYVAWPVHDPPPDRAKAAQIEAKLLANVNGWLDHHDLARDATKDDPTRWVLSVDVAQLLIYAAQSGNRTLYEKLRDDYARWVIITDNSDPTARGMVCWRARENDREKYYEKGTTKGLDASGTTEAILLCKGLWLGSQAFNIPADRDLAVLMAKAYVRHAGVENGVWLIRNYYNFQTHDFDHKAWMVDFDPDFVREIAQATGDKELTQVAEKSYEAVQNAVAPCGLIYDLLVPDVGTMYPHNMNLTYFSPNDVVQLVNAATIAETVALGRPKVARGVLHFALDRYDRNQQFDPPEHPERRKYLRYLYIGRTGEPATLLPPGGEAYSTLLRIAVALHDVRAFNAFHAKVMDWGTRTANNPWEPKAYEAGQLLLALQAAKQMK